MDGALKPVHVLADVVALRGPKNCAHVLHVCALLITFTVAVILRQIIEPIYDNTKGPIIATAQFAHYNFRLFAVVCCLILNNTRSGSIADFLAGLRTLEHRFKVFGLQLDYRFIRNLGRALIAYVFVKVIIEQVSFFAIGYSFGLINVCDYIVYNVPIIVIHIVLTQWIIYMNLLCLHFKTLTSLAKTLRTNNGPMVQDLGTKPKCHDIIYLCSAIYDELCTQSARINRVFDWQILLLIPTLFSLLIFNTFQTCRMINDLIQIDSSWLIFDVLYFGMVLELVVPCVRVREDANKFAEVLHEMTDIDERVDLLLLQTHHRTVEFSGCGVFPLDATLVYAIVGALTTYLVILLQFDL